MIKQKSENQLKQKEQFSTTDSDEDFNPSEINYSLVLDDQYQETPECNIKNY